jgi:hypothetical protein
MLKDAPGVIRTHNLLIRSQMLYPIELRVRKDPKTSPKAGEVKQTGSRIGGAGILFLITESYKQDFCFILFMGRTLRSFVAIW